jgi:hypothetical protein
MVADAGYRLCPRWGDRALQLVIERALSLDLEVSIATWPPADRAEIDTHVAYLEPLLGYGVAAWEMDIEAMWTGIKDRPAISQYLVERGRGLVSQYDARLDITTHCWHSESSERAMISPHCDRIIVQAYSIATRNGTAIHWASPLGPGRLQRRAGARARGIPGSPSIGIGLPLWGQSWPGHRPEQALRIAFDSSLELGPVELRFWSSKHLPRWDNGLHFLTRRAVPQSDLRPPARRSDP